MTVTYVNEGDAATPANMNTWLNQAAGDAVSVKLHGAEGDGTTDDTVAIQAAMTAAAGGFLYFPPGTYLISTFITGVSNVVVYGAGESSIITCSADLASQNGMLDFIEKDGITVRDLYFKYTGTSDGNQLSFHGCDRVHVSNCWFNQTDNTNISNVACIGIYDDGGASAGSSGPVHIVNNRFNPTNIAVLAQGRSTFSLDELVITGNSIDGTNVNSASQGTGLIKVDLNVNNCTVANNVIDGGAAAYDGINVQENVNCISVTGNVVRDCQRNGIIFQDGQTGGAVNEGVIANNVIEGISGTGNQRGIDLDISNGGSIRNIVVANNVIRDCVGEGITENGTAITRLVISGNLIDEFDNAASGKVGILVRGTNVLVTGNTVNHSTSGGAGNPVSFRVAAAGTALVIGNHFLAQNDTTAVTENGTATFIGNTNVNDNDFTGFIAVGPTPASAGTLRLPNNSSIRFRNNADSGDITALTFNTSDQIVAGADVVPASGGGSNLGTPSLYFNVGYFGDSILINNTTTPASASATGTAGTIAWDSSYIYVCVATDTWKRVAIATW